MISITKKTTTAKTTYAPGRTINYIVIHYTAGVTSKPGSAVNVANYFANSGAEASADFIVDDSTIVQYNSDIKNRYCWSVGGGRLSTKGGRLYGKATNRNTINIEVCSSNSAGRITSANDQYFYFTDAAVKNAVELTKYLMKQYGIPVSNVIRHYDVTGKLCPGVRGWNADSGSEQKWQEFKAALTASSGTSSGTSRAVNYTVKVPYALSIFAQPGTDQKVTGKCPPGIYTIVAESSGKGAKLFGKLKSGAGWIALDHCTRYQAGQTKTVDQLAREVIRGKWGSGDERKRRLTAAGYDYDAVQKKVNEMMR